MGFRFIGVATLATLPSNINGVKVEFGPHVLNSIDDTLLECLSVLIQPNIANGPTLTTIYVSSMKDQHFSPSRHMTGDGKAIDISRINGKKIAESYKKDRNTQMIVNAIQTKFELQQGRRENFGPLFKKKSGRPFAVDGHHDHIHLSVD